MLFDRNVLKDTIFEAKVVNNNDPMNRQRVRIRVPRIHDKTKDADLPWALKHGTSMVGTGSGYGEYGVPANGSIVYVIFQQGDPHNPMWTGNKFLAVTGFGPNDYGFRDINGNYFKVSKQSGEIELHHFTGKFLKFNADGSITAEFGDTTITAQNVTVEAQDASITVANCTLEAQTVIANVTTSMQVTCPSVDFM